MEELSAAISSGISVPNIAIIIIYLFSCLGGDSCKASGILFRRPGNIMSMKGIFYILSLTPTKPS